MIRAFVTALAMSLALPAATLPAMADQSAASIGPELGEAAPAFKAVAVDGSSVSASEAAGDAGAVLVFSRSLDWCPYCKKQAIELNEIAGELSEMGWTLNLVTYDDPSVLSGFAGKHEISYQLLSDPDSAMITSYGLLNTGMPEGTMFYGVPHPAILFLDADWTLQAQLSEEAYQNRPELELIMQTATSLSEAGLNEASLSEAAAATP